MNKGRKLVTFHSSLVTALKRFYRFRFFDLLAALFARTAIDCARVHAEADAEDGGMGLLRCEGGAGVAREVG